MKRGRSFMKYRMGSRDANHASIRDGLRALGHFVIDLAAVGGGVPDICVFRRSGVETTLVDVLQRLSPVWLEVKVAKGKLRESQREWRERAEARGLRVATVRTLDEALEALQ